MRIPFSVTSVFLPKFYTTEGMMLPSSTFAALHCFLKIHNETLQARTRRISSSTKSNQFNPRCGIRTISPKTSTTEIVPIDTRQAGFSYFYRPNNNILRPNKYILRPNKLLLGRKRYEKSVYRVSIGTISVVDC